MHSRFSCAIFPAMLVGGLCLQAAETPSFRLGDSVVPERYRVELTLSPAQDTFSGTVDIEANLRRSQSTIWLNATNITVEQATVNGSVAQAVTEGADFLGLKMTQ